MAQEKYLGENGLKRLVGLVKEDLGTKANIDGSYDGLQSGSAKQIVSPTGITDTTPYVFRTTCGETSISGGDEQLASLKAIRGNTIAWNQLLSANGNSETINGITFTHNGDGTISVVGTATATASHYFSGPIGGLLANHKYLLKGCPAGGGANSYSLNCSGNLYDRGNGFIATITSNQTPSCRIEVYNGTTINLVFRPQLFDLTQMFGPGNEPTSVLEFTRLFPKLYYPFNAGEPRNVKIKGLKTTGYNAFDGELEQGGLGNGQPFNSTADVRSKNFIKVVGGQTYTLEESATSNKWKNRYVAQYDAEKNHIRDIGFGNSVGGFGKAYSATLDDNCCYVKIKYFAEQVITPSDFHDVAFHIKWSGSRTGWEPHEEHILHIDTAKYFPDGMNGVGTAYDELTPKVAIKRFAKVDLGTLNWVYWNGRFHTSTPFTNAKGANSNADKPNIVCLKYETLTPNQSVGENDKQITIYPEPYIYIKDFDYTDATTFKQAMSGVYLIYELANPEITEIPQVRDNHWEIKVDDYGTEGWLFAEGNEIPVPVGHETLYMDNLVDKLRNLPDPEDYKTLESEVQTWVKLPPLPTDTSKTYVPKFVNGTIKWVEE